MALEVTDGNITETLANNKITILDFWASWCGPCRILGPIIEELAEANKDIAIGKVNVDENAKISLQYGIRGIPTTIFFKDGEIIEKVVGLKTKADFQTIINGLKDK
jgi:thioredoxin 1